MKDRVTDRVERVKTLLLVVLSLVTILLLYLLWSEDSRGRFRLPDILPGRPEVSAYAAEDVLKPGPAILSRGDGSYRILEQEREALLAWSLKQLRQLSAASGVLAGDITRAQYEEAMRQYPSMVLPFDYALPYQELCRRWNLTAVPGTDNLRSLRSLAFSQADSHSIFLADPASNRYYRLYDSEETLDFEDFPLDLTEVAPEDFYYEIGSVLGGDNRALILLATEEKGINYKNRTESEEQGQLVRQSLAETLFGENYDFVRRITDSFGNVTYMYGYGQKTLTHYRDGLLEYKDEVGSGASAGFFHDLETGLAFLAAHEIFKDPGEACPYILADAEAITVERNSGYRFSFTRDLGGRMLFPAGGWPVVVEVLNDQVAYLRREPLNPELVEDQPQATYSWDAANLLGRNYPAMGEALFGQAFYQLEEGAFEQVIDALLAMERGYLLLEGEELLQPTWIVQAQGQEEEILYFSLMEGQPFLQSRVGR